MRILVACLLAFAAFAADNPAANYHLDNFQWELDGARKTITGATITPAFLETVKTPPLLGRNILAEEFKSGRAAVVVISYRLWQQLKADPTVIGKTVKLNDRAATIVGVMPSGFATPEKAELWVPKVEAK